MPEPRAAAKNRPPADAPIREEDEDEEEDDGHIKSDSDEDDDDEEDDHHEHDDVNVDGMVHGLQSKRILMSSVGSSPVTPPPPPRLNQTPPMPATATPPPPVLESQMATWDYFFGPTPTPPPTLEQPADDTLWMERRDKQPVAGVKAPVAKSSVVTEPAATEKRPPQTAAEKEKAIEEMVANLPPSKPIVRKPPKSPGPPPGAHYQHASSMGAVETRKGKVMVASGTASLLHIVTQLDDHFLRASESAYDVSKKLEATRMHYHSNHADSRGEYCYSICFLICMMLHTY